MKEQTMSGKKILIAGASGMIGSLILKNALKSDDVTSVICLVRHSLSISDPKLTEIKITDFLIETMNIQKVMILQTVLRNIIRNKRFVRSKFCAHQSRNFIDRSQTLNNRTGIQVCTFFFFVAKTPRCVRSREN